jgi:hypothetical protein
MINLTRKVNKVNLPGEPTMKSHMTKTRCDVLVGEAITEGCWLTASCWLGFRTWYFNSNKHECMRSQTLGIYLLKYLHHPELNWVMMNPVIQALINLRTLKNNLGMQNRRKSVRDIILWLNQKWILHL